MWYSLSCVSDIVGTILGAIMYKCIGVRKSLVFSFGMVTFGSVLLFLVNDLPLEEKNPIDKIYKITLYKAILSMFFKFAVAAAFCVIYCVNFMFPP